MEESVLMSQALCASNEVLALAINIRPFDDSPTVKLHMLTSVGHPELLGRPQVVKVPQA